MYCAQVLPGCGSKVRYSVDAHVTLAVARPVDSTAETRYVKGERRYMKIQKPGNAVGDVRTPQKTRQSENIKLAILPPVSASSIAAMTMCAKVEVKIRNMKMSRNMRAPRS